MGAEVGEERRLTYAAARNSFEGRRSGSGSVAEISHARRVSSLTSESGPWLHARLAWPGAPSQTVAVSPSALPRERTEDLS